MYDDPRITLFLWQWRNMEYEKLSDILNTKY